MIFDYIILNGDLIPLEQAHISLFNPAYFSSFGVYETVKIDQGRPFYLAEHLHRLHKSAQMIGLELGVTVETLEAWFNKLLNLDPHATWSLKILVLGAMEAAGNPIIALQPTPLPTYPDAFYERGASAVCYEGQRFKPMCKSLNTLVNTLARRAATQAGALEGLLHYDGYFTEGSRSNLFVVHKEQLLTAPATTVLSGITRDIILAVMAETDYPVVETEVIVDPQRYDEIFISRTSMHVMPITQIEGQPVGDGQVGPLTKVAMSQFKAYYQHLMPAE
jgi:branched-subunit amino acid aminotransferase/4-amino-4-deoxychorismate lyase